MKKINLVKALIIVIFAFFALKILMEVIINGSNIN